jgi:hypothetical protein
MNELYLILHKVRGEPAFDIAQKVQIGKEEGWIIPTSGHRAYPHKTYDLGKLTFGECYHPEPIPDDLPDHYEPKRDDGSHLINQAREILLRKGLITAAKPAAQLYRRS